MNDLLREPPATLECGACGQIVVLVDPHPGFGEPGYRHPGGRCPGRRDDDPDPRPDEPLEGGAA